MHPVRVKPAPRTGARAGNGSCLFRPLVPVPPASPQLSGVHDAAGPGTLEVRELWGSDHRALLYAAVSCCERAAGDAAGAVNEVCLAVLRRAAEYGIHQREVDRRRPRVRGNPFDAVRRRASTWREDGVLYVVGEVDAVLPLCLGDAPGAAEAAASMVAGGLRVVAVATGSSEREVNLTLWGLIGLGAPAAAAAPQG